MSCQFTNFPALTLYLPDIKFTAYIFIIMSANKYLHDMLAIQVFICMSPDKTCNPTVCRILDSGILQLANTVIYLGKMCGV